MANTSEKALYIGTALMMVGPALYGSVTVLSMPPPDWILPPDDRAMAIAEKKNIKRTYMALDRQIVFDIGRGTNRAVLKIAFVAELEPTQLMSVGSAALQKEESIVAQMNEDVLNYGEKLEGAVSATKLAQDLPPLLLRAVNRILATEEVPVPVAEVLILDLIVQ